MELTAVDRTIEFIPTSITINFDSANELGQFLSRLQAQRTLDDLRMSLPQYAAWENTPIKSETLTDVVDFQPVVDAIGHSLDYRNKHY